MKKVSALVTLMLLVSTTAFSQVVCDNFDVQWVFSEEYLALSLITDLPDDTDITISVSRSYILKENSERYSVDYYESKTTAKELRSERKINISNDDWQKKLAADLKQKATFGVGTTYKSIDDTVWILVLAPARQTNPSFGKWNSNLSGKMVSKGTFKIVKSEISLPLPMAGETSIPSFTNATSLKPSQKYIVPKRIPLMSEFNPNDYLKAVSTSIWLEPGYTIRVITISKKHNTPWYEVQASNDKNVDIGRGWINSTALLGQTIRLVK